MEIKNKKHDISHAVNKSFIKNNPACTLAPQYGTEAGAKKQF
jgi:hypothetical protein